MTISEELKRETINAGAVEVAAVREQEKHSSRWTYYVMIVRAGSPIVQACDLYKCAATTWRKKFNEVRDNELIKEYERAGLGRVEYDQCGYSIVQQYRGGGVSVERYPNKKELIWSIRIVLAAHNEAGK